MGTGKGPRLVEEEVEALEGVLVDERLPRVVAQVADVRRVAGEGERHHLRAAPRGRDGALEPVQPEVVDDDAHSRLPELGGADEVGEAVEVERVGGGDQGEPPGGPGVGPRRVADGLGVVAAGPGVPAPARVLVARCELVQREQAAIFALPRSFGLDAEPECNGGAIICYR